MQLELSQIRDSRIAFVEGRAIMAAEVERNRTERDIAIAAAESWRRRHQSVTKALMASSAVITAQVGVILWLLWRQA